MENVNNAASLLRKVSQHIMEEPKRCDMDYWMLRGITMRQCKDEDHRPACGTVGCIAGWIKVLSGSEETDSAYRVASGLLGLTGHKGDSLFYINSWPAGYRNRIDGEVAGTPKYAQVVADRIEDFIEKELPPAGAGDRQ